MLKYFLVCILFTLLGAFGGLFFKKASSSCNNIFKILFCPYLYIGSIFYLLGALLNIWLLKFFKYSIVLPLTSITYIWTMFISSIFLKEKISNKKILGVVLILIGAIILGLNK